MAHCHTCDKATRGCFDNTKGVKKCVENCLKGPPQPYECETYNPRDVISKCSKENSYIGHPKDNSVFFKCIRIDGDFSPVCYACNFKMGTCFSTLLASCVNPGDEGNCDGVDPVDHGVAEDVVRTSRSYDAEGYRKSAFPCAYKGKGDHGFPADLSVYVTCQQKYETEMKFEWVASFKVCGSREKNSYYDISTHSCKDVITTTAAPPKLQVCKLPYATCQRVTGLKPGILEPVKTTQAPIPKPKKKKGKAQKAKEFKSFG